MKDGQETSHTLTAVPARMTQSAVFSSSPSKKIRLVKRESIKYPKETVNNYIFAVVAGVILILILKFTTSEL